MYFPYNRDEAGALERFLLGKHFTTKRVADGELGAANLQHYVASIQHSVQNWRKIYFPLKASALPDDVRGALDGLDRLGRGAFEPLLMGALQVTEDEGDLLGLLNAAEQFVFVVNRLCRVRADAGDYEFYRLANEVYSRQTTVPKAREQINARTARHFSKEKALTEMRELFRYDVGFYSWTGLRYFCSNTSSM